MKMSTETVNDGFDIIYGEELGSGRFGVVVKCTIPDVDGARRTYAAKLPSSAEEFFEVEAYALKKSQHSLVIKFHESFSSVTGHLIMDYHPLGNLDKVKQLLSREFSFQELRFILDQCVEALTFVHSNMIIHNDVKPSNILMDSSGHIKVADFGSARVCFKLGTHQLYPGDDICCSHLPPECSSGRTYWHALDWFSVASVVYYLAYGDYPYPRNSGMTPDEISSVFEKPLVFHPPLPSHLVSLISRMLHLSPHERLGGGLTDGLEIIADPEFSHCYERNGRFSVKKARHMICRLSFPRLKELLSYSLD